MPPRLRLYEFLRSRRQQIPRSAKGMGPYVRCPDRIGKLVSQEEMAEALEVSRQWYGLLETGAAHASPALLNRISSVLSLQYDEHVELFRLAIPELGGSGSDGHPQLRGELSFDASSAFALTASSRSDVETTARLLDGLREQYLSGNQWPSHLRPRVLGSWLRSQSALVDPSRMAAAVRIDREVEIRELRERNEQLLLAAQEVIQSLIIELGHAGFGIIVTDNNGCVLQVEGERDVRCRLEKVEVRPGGDMHEDASGTNAIGTALADFRPIQVTGGEHFIEAWQGLTCSAALIHDPQTAQVIGVLDITGNYNLARGPLLGLIMQSALEIEEALAVIKGEASRKSVSGA